MFHIRLVAKNGDRIANPPNTKLLEYKPIGAELELKRLEEEVIPLYRQLQAI